MESKSKYWFISYYAPRTERMPATAHNVIVKCKHPLFHIQSLYWQSLCYHKAIFWEEIVEDIAKQVIEQNIIPFEEVE